MILYFLDPCYIKIYPRQSVPGGDSVSRQPAALLPARRAYGNMATCPILNPPL